MPASKPVENTKSGNEEKSQTQTAVVAEGNRRRKFVTSVKRGNAVKRQNNAQKDKFRNAENLTGKFEKIASKQKRSETQRNEKPPRRKSDD